MTLILKRHKNTTLKKKIMKNSRKHSYIKVLTYVLIDIILTLLVWFLYFISFSNGVSAEQRYGMIIFALGLALLTVALFFVGRIYKLVLTNIGTPDIFKVGIYATIPQLVALILLYTVPDNLLPHTKIIFIPWMFVGLGLVFFLTVIRVIPRIIYSYFLGNNKDGKRTIVVGAGAAAKIIIDESRKNKDFHNKVVALVDDDANKIGGRISNIPIKGPISDIAKFVEECKAEEVIIAISDLTSKRLREIVHYLDNSKVRIRKMPILSELAGPNDHRVVDVDLDELLCREPVKLDNHETYELLHGNTVLVTGAGGSIGSELVRQIFMTHPKTLVLFDIYENSTYDIQMELVKKMRDEHITDIELVTLIGSTYNDVRVEQILRRYHPDYIYHAAAYKHVPLMEDSPMEAIRTNVIGTYNVAKLADKYHVKKMVLVSTDKAVRPTNVMGATKRFAETIIQYFAEKSEDTAYAAVRFGNVLGSNGSVVPLFKKQIEKGGPITLTHKDIIRYFMTIPEAVSLILQCSLYAEGGEIFILDMGEPVKILTLAEKLIRQSGLTPYKDIDIIETGLRPGEKLYEELLLDKDHQLKTPNEKIFIEEKEEKYDAEANVKEISKIFQLDENEDIKKMLADIITTYQYKKK